MSDHDSQNQADQDDSNAPPPPDGIWSTVAASLSGKQFDVTSLPIKRAIVLLAIPMVLELAMESLFAITDIFWVAKLGSQATAAVGLTEAVLTLYYAIAMGLSMAVTATVARRVGEKRNRDAENAAAQAIYLGLVIGAITGAACFFAAPHILGLMGADPETVHVGTGYARIILGGNLVVMLLFLNNAIFRGAGDAALAMRALWLGNGINIALDPLLIFGLGPVPAMGLTGAALATLIGRSVAVVYQLWVLAGPGKASRLKLRGQTAWSPDIPAAMRILRVSIGGIAQFAVATTSWVVLMRLMATFGSNVLAGYTIAIRILIFTILPSWGLSNAAATLVGQNLGAGEPERAERSVIITGVYNMVFLMLIGIGFQFLSPPIVALFTQDPEVSATAVLCLRILATAYIFYGWGMILVQGFNGAGDTMTPTWLNIACFWAFQIPVAWYLVIRFDSGPTGVFWIIAIAESLLAVLAFIFFKRGKWKHAMV